MFAVEFTSSRPAGAAPYYSLVVRDEYIVGSAPESDICLAAPDIAPQHVSLLVMRQSQANEEAEAAGGEGVHAAQGEVPPGEEGAVEPDPLVVFLTVLPTNHRGAGTVYVGETEVPAGGSIILMDQTEVQFGGSATVVFHYRPLVVSLDPDPFTAEYLRDLSYMLERLGATVVEEPTQRLHMPPPIGLLHCTEELYDSLSCVVALACGYSIVQPTYVLEWFATLAQTASAPLSVLPAPAKFEVPIRSTVHAPRVGYLRPEPDTTPFSLFPIPTSARASRDRSSLFKNKVFFFFTDAAAARYRVAASACGATCFFPTDAEDAIHMVRLLSVEQSPPPGHEVSSVHSRHSTSNHQHHSAAGAPGEPIFPQGFYIVVDSVAEATLLNEGLRGASAELAKFLEDAKDAGAEHLPVIGDHVLYTALLANTFILEEIPLDAERAPMPEVDQEALANYNFQMPAASATAPTPTAPVEESAAPPQAPKMAALPIYRVQQQQQQQRRSTTGAAPPAPVSARGASSDAGGSVRRVSREEIRRSSLLPRGTDRTPSRSQLRSYSRQRAMSQSGDVAGSDRLSSARGGAGANDGTSTPRSARRKMRSASAGGPLVSGISFGDHFDIVRVRVYAFLLKEDPKLDKAIASYKRNSFVEREMMEHALEVRAQAQDYMERIDELLDVSYGTYTDSLRHFWQDCSDLDEKAKQLVVGFDRQVRGARRRSSVPRRASVGRRRSSATAGGDSARRSSTSVMATARDNLLKQQHDELLQQLQQLRQQQEGASGSTTGGVPAPLYALEEPGASAELGRSAESGGSLRDHRDAYRSVNDQQRASFAQAVAANRSPRKEAESTPYQTYNNGYLAEREGRATPAERDYDHRPVRRAVPIVVKARRAVDPNADVDSASNAAQPTSHANRQDSNTYISAPQPPQRRELEPPEQVANSTQSSQQRAYTQSRQRRSSAGAAAPMPSMVRTSSAGRRGSASQGFANRRL